ncbi:MAG: hypothetical protein A2X56_00415 [Nitrospirae bacterium GWC2_57_13]|nr:MAG: hypothetical protein A2X56_00415 [Nitrospirae bacterium GWC2_57_13]
MPEAILLVDDEEMILDSLSAILSREGYVIDCAANGEAALVALKQKPFDLVISDVRMPGMNGLELVERIKAFLPDQKILIITGYGSLDTAVKAQHRGVCDYLIKPIDIQGLKNSIRRALDLKPAVDAPAAEVRQLDNKLKDLTQYFALISEFTASLNASLDVNEIVQATLERLTMIGETDIVSINLFPSVVHEMYYLKNIGELPPFSAGRGISIALADAGPMISEPLVVAAPDQAGGRQSDPRLTLVQTAMVRDNIIHALLLPVAAKEKIFGIIDVSLQRDEAFTEIDVQLARTIVNQASLALAKAFSYLEMQERSKEIGLLYNLSLRLNQSLKITDSIKAICEGAIDITGAAGSLLQTSLEPGAIKNFIFHKDLGFHKEIKRGSQDWLIPTQARKEAFFSNDPVMDPRVNSLALYSLGIKSLAYVPLIYEWEDMGGLTVFYKTEGKTFDERDLHLLHLFARHASEVLLNAQLFESIKKSREKIITEKNKMDIVLSTMADGVVTMDRDGRITYVNEAMLKMTGMEESRMLGKLCDDIFGREQSAAACEVKEVPAERPADAFYEGYLTGQDGSRTPVYVSLATLRDSEGQVTGWVKVFRNIERMKEVDRLKDAFFHALAHDLRSPLMSLMGFLEIIAENGALSDKQKNAVGIMEKSAADMNDIIDDLLDVYRSRNAGILVREQEFDLHELVGSALKEMEGIAGSKGVGLERVKLNGACPVLADAGLIRRALSNLLSNAIKNTPEGGKVRVSVDRPNVKNAPAQQQDGALFVIVEDTGRGLSDDDRTRIFDRFYQSPGQSGEKASGTGLGLAITREIVDAHGGSIWAENAEGGGTRFTFTLPPKGALRPPPAVSGAGKAAS